MAVLKATHLLCKYRLAGVFHVLICNNYLLKIMSTGKRKCLSSFVIRSYTKAPLRENSPIWFKKNDVSLNISGKQPNLHSRWTCKYLMLHEFVRYIHTSPCKRALPEFVIEFIRNAAKLSVIVVGRRIRDYRSALSKISQDSVVETSKKNTLRYVMLCTAFLAPIVLGMGWFYTSHLVEDPLTKRTRFIAFTEEQMARLTVNKEERIEDEFGYFFLNMSDPRVERVAQLVERILDANSDVMMLQNRPWPLSVIDKSSITNASVLPNGHIYVFTGLIQLCNDDQLGIILAHEMSHVVLRHSAEELSYFIMLEILEIVFLVQIVFIMALFSVIGCVLVVLLANVLKHLLFHLPFSRHAEMEADRFGVELASKACFDVRQFIHILVESTDGPRRHFEWLSTHPSHEARVYHLERLLPLALELRRKHNCPELPCADPRMNGSPFKERIKERD